jgi:hypothetical protein
MGCCEIKIFIKMNLPEIPRWGKIQIWKLMLVKSALKIDDQRGWK